MNIDYVTTQNNTLYRKNKFIEYTNKFMSLGYAKEHNNEKKEFSYDKHLKVNDDMGIEKLTIFPKKIKDGITIITA